MYFEVFLEGFCVRLPAILGLEDDLIRCAVMSGIGAALATQSWCSFGSVDCRRVGSHRPDARGVCAMVRARPSSKAERSPGGALTVSGCSRDEPGCVLHP